MTERFSTRISTSAAIFDKLIEAFTQLFKNGLPPDPLVVLDVGCGPFTGGLPSRPFLVMKCRSARHRQPSSMRELGERLAVAAVQTGALNCADRRWVQDFDSILWQDAPGWRPILVIASYLLASSSLDAELLVANVEALCARLGRGPVTVLYTNSADYPGANRRFGAFRSALERLDFPLSPTISGRLRSSGSGYGSESLICLPP